MAKKTYQEMVEEKKMAYLSDIQAKKEIAAMQKPKKKYFFERSMPDMDMWGKSPI